MLPERSPGLAPDERRPAPGAAQRLRLAALRSIAATALAAAAADVLQIVASDVAEHTAACLSDGYPPAIHGAASEVGGLHACTSHEHLILCCKCVICSTHASGPCYSVAVFQRLDLPPPSGGIECTRSRMRNALLPCRRCWRWQRWTPMRCGSRWSPWLQLRLMRRPRPGHRAPPSQASCRSAYLHCWNGVTRFHP